VKLSSVELVLSCGDMLSPTMIEYGTDFAYEFDHFLRVTLTLDL